MKLETRFGALKQIVLGLGVLAVLFFAALPRASADTVTVNSSAAVTYLDSGSSSTDFSAPFTAANFTSARTGPAASLLTSTPSYVSSLVDAPAAKWIGTNATAGVGTGDTALYAVSFNLASVPSSASLLLYYAVDNILGSTNPGIYINGTALPNSTSLLCSECVTSFTQENSYTDASIGSLLVAGTNWLYIDAVNQGGPAGLIFSANINTTPVSTTPEPSSILSLGIGLLGVLAVALRRKHVAPSLSC